MPDPPILYTFYMKNPKLFDVSKNNGFSFNFFFTGSVVLCEGDTVTFGHTNGENILVGTRIRQPNSEFQYIVRNQDIFFF